MVGLRQELWLNRGEERYKSGHTLDYKSQECWAYNFTSPRKYRWEYGRSGTIIMDNSGRGKLQSGHTLDYRSQEC